MYTSDTKKEQLGKQGVTVAVRFFFLSMKKHQSNPVGPLVLKHLKEHVEGLYTYLMSDNLTEDAEAKKITDDLDKHFGVFIVKWNDSLDHWMVDYNIIHILKCTTLGTQVGQMFQQIRGIFGTRITVQASNFLIGI